MFYSSELMETASQVAWVYEVILIWLDIALLRHLFLYLKARFLFDRQAYRTKDSSYMLSRFKIATLKFNTCLFQ
ncbi:MAG: hypothetical protein D3922_03050 [Candidatus Electrothrix sp. AR1]|nr:hypothetical protein [Candidatus Electrothrix sp. AR1]